MDTYLTIGAILIEFGLPIALIYFSITLPSKRKIFIPILGAVTPMVLYLIIGTIDYTFITTEENSMFMAGFVMGFFIYCLLAFTGFILGVALPKSINLYWRYAIAFVLGPVCGWGFLALESM